MVEDPEKILEKMRPDLQWNIGADLLFKELQHCLAPKIQRRIRSQIKHEGNQVAVETILHQLLSQDDWTSQLYRALLSPSINRPKLAKKLKGSNMERELDRNVTSMGGGDNVHLGTTPKKFSRCSGKTKVKDLPITFIHKLKQHLDIGDGWKLLAVQLGYSSDAVGSIDLKDGSPTEHLILHWLQEHPDADLETIFSSLQKMEYKSLSNELWEMCESPLDFVEEPCSNLVKDESPISIPDFNPVANLLTSVDESLKKGEHVSPTISPITPHKAAVTEMDLPRYSEFYEQDSALVESASGKEVDSSDLIDFDTDKDGSVPLLESPSPLSLHHSALSTESLNDSSTSGISKSSQPSESSFYFECSDITKPQMADSGFMESVDVKNPDLIEHSDGLVPLDKNSPHTSNENIVCESISESSEATDMPVTSDQHDDDDDSSLEQMKVSDSEPSWEDFRTEKNGKTGNEPEIKLKSADIEILLESELKTAKIFVENLLESALTEHFATENPAISFEPSLQAITENIEKSETDSSLIESQGSSWDNEILDVKKPETEHIDFGIELQESKPFLITAETFVENVGTVSHKMEIPESLTKDENNAELSKVEAVIDATEIISKEEPAIDTTEIISKEDPAIDATEIISKEDPAIDTTEIISKEDPAIDTTQIISKEDPAIDTTEIISKEDPAIDTTEIISKEEPAIDTTEIISKEEPAIDTTEIISKEEPAIDTTEIISKEVPAIDTTEIISKEVPAIDTTEIISKEEPAIDTTEIISKEEPAIDTTEIISKEVPAIDTTEIISKEVPAIDTTEIISKDMSPESKSRDSMKTTMMLENTSVCPSETNSDLAVWEAALQENEEHNSKVVDPSDRASAKQSEFEIESQEPTTAVDYLENDNTISEMDSREGLEKDESKSGLLEMDGTEETSKDAAIPEIESVTEQVISKDRNVSLSETNCEMRVLEAAVQDNEEQITKNEDDDDISKMDGNLSTESDTNSRSISPELESTEVSLSETDIDLDTKDLKEEIAESHDPLLDNVASVAQSKMMISSSAANPIVPDVNRMGKSINLDVIHDVLSSSENLAKVHASSFPKSETEPLLVDDSSSTECWSPVQPDMALLDIAETDTSISDTIPSRMVSEESSCCTIELEDSILAAELDTTFNCSNIAMANTEPEVESLITLNKITEIEESSAQELQAPTTIAEVILQTDNGSFDEVATTGTSSETTVKEDNVEVKEEKEIEMELSSHAEDDICLSSKDSDLIPQDDTSVQQNVEQMLLGVKEEKSSPKPRSRYNFGYIVFGMAMVGSGMLLLHKYWK